MGDVGEMERRGESGIALLERAATARGRILRVDQLQASGPKQGPARAPGYLLTFDSGRVLVAADASSGTLEIRSLASLDEVGGQLVALVEEEPWWRVLGNPITRVWPGASGAGAASGEGALRDLRVQFREDTEHPKVISFRYRDGAVAVAEESSDG